MNKLTLSILIVLIFCSSCGSANSIKSTPQPLPSASDKWSVKLTQTGGIAGVFLTVQVSSDGQLIAADQRSHRSVTRSLPSPTIAELRRLILNSSVSSSQLPKSICADCFIYNLEIQSEGNNVKTQVDDVTINDSGVQELIAILLKIRDEALRPNP